MIDGLDTMITLSGHGVAETSAKLIAGVAGKHPEVSDEERAKALDDIAEVQQQSR